MAKDDVWLHGEMHIGYASQVLCDGQFDFFHFHSPKAHSLAISCFEDKCYFVDKNVAYM